jgi:YD repeat-containing protein
VEPNSSVPFTDKKPPAQRKTTLKWDDNGDLTAVDMARIIDRLTNPELNRCELDES